MIRQDSISIALTVLAVSQIIYLATFGPELMVIALFIGFLAISALVLQRLTGGVESDPRISGMETRSSLKWVLICLSTIVLMNLFVPLLPFKVSGGNTVGIGRFSTIPAFSVGTVALSFALLIAVTEEQFFRGFAANWFARFTGTTISSVMGGLFFAVYHLAVYGSTPQTLLIVAGGGTILTFAAFQTQRVSTSLVAHVINNAAATLLAIGWLR